VLLLIVLRLSRYAAFVILFLLGSAYAFFFIYFTNFQFSPGCYTGRVSSQISEYSEGKNRYSFSSGRGRVVIESESKQGLGYADKVEVCLSDEYSKDIDKGRDKYYLSNYLSNQVYKDPPMKYLERGRGFRRSLIDFSDFIAKRFYKLWPGDKGTLAKGLILGGSQNFTKEVGAALKNSGTSHLTAVSGYNVAIITVVVFNLIRLVSKKTAFLITAVVLLSFVFLTGLTPSVVRAALMGGVYLLSKMLGRPKMTMHFLVLAGFILFLANPFIVYNIGFLLSFGATYGLIFAGDFLSKVTSCKNNFWKVILSTLGETTIAQIFVMPVLIYYFGQVSVLSPIANLFILPFIPLTMLLEFIALLFSFANFYVGIFFAKLIEPVLSYIIFVIKFFGSSEHAVITISGTSSWIIIGLYLIFYIAGRVIFKKMRFGNRIK
jgi:competence protein ComEC